MIESFAVLYVYLMCVIFYLCYLYGDILTIKTVVKKIKLLKKIQPLEKIEMGLTIQDLVSSSFLTQLTVIRKNDLKKVTNYFLLDEMSFKNEIGLTNYAVYSDSDEILAIIDKDKGAVILSITGEYLLKSVKGLFDKTVFILSGSYLFYLYVSNNIAYVLISLFVQMLFWDTIFTLYQSVKSYLFRNLVLE